MKTLVYENYNKFISATDTIRKVCFTSCCYVAFVVHQTCSDIQYSSKQMKRNVENMEAEMAHLSKNMDKITECSDRIYSTLSPRRDKIEQLSGVHRLLQKVCYLFFFLFFFLQLIFIDAL
jgi:vacuolar protein sorting-associated protein 51